MLANSISVENAKNGKLFYFVANVVVYRPSDGRVLILKRAKTEKVFPDIWGIVGGKLEHGDFDISKPDKILNGQVINFISPIEKLLQREVKEEAGLNVRSTMHYLKSVVFVRPDKIPVIFVIFAAEYESGEVVPEPGAFSDFAWVNEEELSQYDCIEGMEEEVAAAARHFRDAN
jgi:8-oxo-dGTP pyrophosphatase MutT (NUDIX family)